jgi:hypothetical protein
MLLVLGARAESEPVELVLGECVGAEAEEIRRLVEIELGEPAAPGKGAVRVEVACGHDALVVTVVDRVRGSLSFRIDLSGTPAVARARLIALTIAEAVAASPIELGPEPPASSVRLRFGPLPWVTSGIARASRSAAEVDGAARLTGVAGARTLGSYATTVGGGVAACVPLGDHAAVSGDVLAEGGLSPVNAGNVRVFLASLAPRVVARARYRSVVVEAGAGIRVGLARLAGEAGDSTMLDGRVVHAPWGGPIAVSAIHVAIGGRGSVGFGVEAGYTTLSVVGRVPMAPPVELRGAWLGLQLSAGVDLR